MEGVKAILAQPDTATHSGQRDLALLCLMYDTGARVQEIADLTAGDVRIDSPATIRLTGKGRKSRIMPIMGRTAELLEVYMNDNDMFQQHKKLCVQGMVQNMRKKFEREKEEARKSAPRQRPVIMTPERRPSCEPRWSTCSRKTSF